MAMSGLLLAKGGDKGGGGGGGGAWQSPAAVAPAWQAPPAAGKSSGAWQAAAAPVKGAGELIRVTQFLSFCSCLAARAPQGLG